MLATRPLACLPTPEGAMLGKLGHVSAKKSDTAWAKARLPHPPARQVLLAKRRKWLPCCAGSGSHVTLTGRVQVAGEAARTVPGRENGGAPLRRPEARAARATAPPTPRRPSPRSPARTEARPVPRTCLTHSPRAGNCDIKNLSRGCALYLPVFVPGGNLSMGDMHFSQGDGEVRPAGRPAGPPAGPPARRYQRLARPQVSFCGAIEMSGFLELKCTVGPARSARRGARHAARADSRRGARRGGR